jgi:hypothetical protein
LFPYFRSQSIYLKHFCFHFPFDPATKHNFNKVVFKSKF